MELFAQHLALIKTESEKSSTSDTTKLMLDAILRVWLTWSIDKSFMVRLSADRTAIEFVVQYCVSQHRLCKAAINLLQRIILTSKDNVNSLVILEVILARDIGMAESFNLLWSCDRSFSIVEGPTEEIQMTERKQHEEAELGALQGGRELVQHATEVAGCLREITRDFISSIKVLYIFSNHSLSTIPSIVGVCRFLTELQVEDVKLQTLPSSLSACTNLTSLTVMNCCISIFPSVIVKLRHLIALNLVGNLIRIVPSSIRALQSLETINLSSNVISTVPHAMTALQSLQEIIVGDNKLKLCDVKFEKMQSLRVMDVNRNRGFAFSVKLPGSQFLTKLSLSGTMFRQPDDITNSLAFPALKYLDLSHNNMKRIPKFVWGCKELNILHLNNNR